ncbi:ubiquitin-conjugating enzyme/RWD-like protein [Biscogniauxia marginata]|nr:ubiquitin-conjugating enzyme/RWD-like protein [Biscogniauxia marginata]
MATPRFNSKSPTIRRILKEAAELSNSPSPEYTASPLESDLFEWHFTMRGPPKSAFAEGIYHGRIVLPPTYPLSPPSFRFTTPSGRFEPNREICLSISGHHEETWQPAWGVRTAIVALRTFMETGANGQIGGLDTSDAVRTRLAAESKGWRCGVCAKSNAEIIAECEERCKALEAESGSAAAPRKEVEVPAELRMGFRDEMEKTKTGEGGGEAAGAGNGGDKEDAESAQLAEGFVQTAPERVEIAPRTSPQGITLPNPLPGAVPLARPAQGVPAPTGRVPLPDPAGQVTAQRPVHVDPNNGVPPWIDYAIMSLVVMLVAMLLKVLAGY